MANAIIEVNTNTLRSDVNEVQGEIRALRSETAKLRNAASALNSTWEGVAKAAFMEALQDDLNKLETLVAASETFTRQTDDARVGYDKCENTVSQIVASLKV